MVQPLNLAEGAEMSNLRAVQIPLPPAGTGDVLEGGSKTLCPLRNLQCVFVCLRCFPG